MFKIAHRGSTLKTYISNGETHYLKFPENSLLSYLNAIEDKFDMIEADIQYTKDNILIMFHDNYIQSQKINNLTYQDILKINNDIITLDTFCNEVLPFIKVIFDIKGNKKTAELLVRFLENNDISLKNAYFSSFNRYHLEILNEYDSNLTLGVIYDGTLVDKEKLLLIQLFNIKFVSIWWENLEDSEIDFYRQKNIKVFTWTNKTYKDYRYINKKVDGIISDYLF